MRLIIIIVRDSDSESVLQALVKENFRVTRIASSGGFLRRGFATLLVGVESKKVQYAIQMVRENSAPGVDPGLKRATIFVLKVDQFEQVD